MRVPQWSFRLPPWVAFPLLAAFAFAGRADEPVDWRGSWRILELRPSAQDASLWREAGFTLVFEVEAVEAGVSRGRVSGRACNSFFGDFEAAGAKARIDIKGMTKMVCAGVPGHMEQELLDLVARGIADLEREGETLRLLYADGDYLALEPAQP